MSDKRGDSVPTEDTEAKPELAWRSPTDAPFRLAGFAWFEQDGLYRRLPLEPKVPIPKSVDNFANRTAGGQIQFQTTSRELWARVELAEAPNMYHMTAAGQCGFDCYVGPPRRQFYRGTVKFAPRDASYESPLFSFPEAEMRNVTVNFPLYGGVKEVMVGLDADARVEAPPPYDGGRVVVYGTSITQGGCAARPGLAYSNILSRRFNREFINLGFSGSGRGEPEMARLMAEIPDTACYVLDYEANAAAEERLLKTLAGFIEILRQAHPLTPILVVSKIRYAGENFGQETINARLGRRDFQRDTVEHLRAAGDEKVFFCDGGRLLGDDFHECTVDGGHPNSMGLWRMAEGLAPVIGEILGDYGETLF